MTRSHSSKGSDRASISVSFLWVQSSSTEISLNSNTFRIISFSSVSMVPFSFPSARSMRISSSVTASDSSLGFNPMSLRIRLVETVSTHTRGAKALATKYKSPDSPSAKDSDFFMAIRFGTSSPSTRLKYAKTSVITRMLAVFKIPGEMVTPAFTRAATNGSEK